MDEISIKFGKGLAEPFTGKDGKEFMRILIPNQDPGDKTPWSAPGVCQRKAGRSREGHGSKAHSGKDSEGQAQEGPGAVRQRGGASCLDT